MASFRPQICALVVMLSLLALTQSAISAPNPPASAPVRPADGNSADLLRVILTSIRLAGDTVFEHPVIISILKQHSGDVAVSFKRPTSERMVTAGRKPVVGLMQMLFTSKHIELRPSNIPLQISKDYSVPQFSEVAESACAYIMNQRGLVDEFELDISREDDAYSVVLTPIPYRPDDNAIVEVRCKSGKLEISSVYPFTTPPVVQPMRANAP